MSILSLNEASLLVAGNYLLDGVNFEIQAKDRIALLGRNGAGKSSLLQVLQNNLVLDAGLLQKKSSLRVAGLCQDVPMQEESVYHFLVHGLGALGEVLFQFKELSLKGHAADLSVCQETMDKLEAWDWLPKIETMATRLDIDVDAKMQDLSGGLKRRVLLAAALLSAPDLLLLDEPTNHLDLEAIEWLESYLKQFNGALVVVTHDRAFLKQVADKIVLLDRGKLHTYDCDYETYLDRREAELLCEQKHQALFDKRLAAEEVWIRTGIKARRTRNEGRVRALKALREEYKARRTITGQIKGFSLETVRSGRQVIEASHLRYSIHNKLIINDFSLLLSRESKLGIIGPNGCGKTTLVRLLLGELKPDSGQIKLGTGLKVAYFDQLRRTVIEDQSLMYNVGDGADYVTINGQSKHVATYLREFLFEPSRFNQLVSTLSGGERNRLLLAKLFAKPVNLLVMDEPTNDLDLETLELLEQMLLEYSGTLIIISHDRAFINAVVTSVLVYEGEGVFSEWVGGYDDYKREKKLAEKSIKTPVAIKKTTVPNKLSFNEQRELAQLPEKIGDLEKKIAEIQAKMASPLFYQQDAQEIAKIHQTLTLDEALLGQLYLRWEVLAERE